MPRKNLLAAALMMVGTLAQAQTFTWTNPYWNYVHTLKSCQRIKPDVIQCNMTLTSKGKDQDTQLFNNYYKLVASDGTEVAASSIQLGNMKPTGEIRQTLRGDANYPLIVTFKGFPGSVARYFYVELAGSYRNENIPILPLSGKAPAPAALPAATSLGTTQAVFGNKAYKVTLTNCKVSGNNYLCSATVTPSR